MYYVLLVAWNSGSGQSAGSFGRVVVTHSFIAWGLA
jgi:hypothetical protein